MARFEDDRERVDALLVAAAASVRRRFLRALRELKEELTLPELERLIAAGRVEEIVRRYAAVAARVADAHQEALLRAARSTVAEVGDQLDRDPGALDLSRPRLSATLRAERQRVEAGLIQVQRVAILAALASAARRGLPLSGQARAVRESLGLTARQVVAVERYREVLERAAAQREVVDLAPRDDEEDEDRPVTAADVRRLSAAYLATTLGLSAAAVGDSESQQATNLGVDLALEQVSEDGLLEESTLIDRWWTARDERVRPSHRAMHGQERPHGQPFRSGDGNLLRWPGDPLAPASDTARCRCIRTTRAGAPEPAGVA